jgi:hypothetical protein
MGDPWAPHVPQGPQKHAAQARPRTSGPPQRCDRRRRGGDLARQVLQQVDGQQQPHQRRQPRELLPHARRPRLAAAARGRRGRCGRRWLGRLCRLGGQRGGRREAERAARGLLHGLDRVDGLVGGGIAEEDAATLGGGNG